MGRGAPAGTVRHRAPPLWTADRHSTEQAPRPPGTCTAGAGRVACAVPDHRGSSGSSGGGASLAQFLGEDLGRLREAERQVSQLHGQFPSEVFEGSLPRSASSTASVMAL